MRQRGADESEDGPDAVYTSESKRNQLFLYSSGPDFEQAATYAMGDRTFATTQEDTEGLDVRPNGKSAEADLQLADIEGETVQLVASFECNKKKRG